MAKNRYVDTRFWDDTFIAQCDPIEKLLFLYFLTNPLTHVCGIYEIVLKRVSFDTGIDKDMVLKILERFDKCAKMKYVDGWIAIKNFAKHQKMNPNIKKGIEDGFLHAPIELVEWVNESLNKPSKGFSMSLLNSDLSLNSDLDIPCKKKPDGIPYDSIIQNLNTQLGTSYKASSQETRRLIRARWDSGFREDDFTAVVRIKKRQWGCDPKMRIYLRPVTLFGTKFESYRQEAKIKSDDEKTYFEAQGNSASLVKPLDKTPLTPAQKAEADEIMSKLKAKYHGGG